MTGMEKAVHIRVLPNWTLEVRFDDGTTGEVCLKDDLYGEVFEPLKDPAFFAQAFIDEDGAICWPNGADLAPDALYEDIRAKTKVA